MSETLTELGFIQTDPTPSSEDDTGGITLLEHRHFKGRSKPVYLRGASCVTTSTLVLLLVQTPSPNQLADIGTKA